MAEAWSSEIFYQEIRHLLKRYFPSENCVSPDDVEVRLENVQVRILRIFS